MAEVKRIRVRRESDGAIMSCDANKIPRGFVAIDDDESPVGTAGLGPDSDVPPAGDAPVSDDPGANVPFAPGDPDAQRTAGE